MHRMRFWGAYQRHGERAILKHGRHGTVHLAVASTWLEASTLRGLFGRTSLRDHFLAGYFRGLVAVVAQPLRGDAPAARGSACALLHLLARAPVLRVALAEAALAQGTTVAEQLAAVHARCCSNESDDAPPETPRSEDSSAALAFDPARLLAETMRSDGGSALQCTREQRVQCLRDLGLDTDQFDAACTSEVSDSEVSDGVKLC